MSLIDTIKVDTDKIDIYNTVRELAVQQNGAQQIVPIGALANNVEYDNQRNIKTILGDFGLDENSIAQQLHENENILNAQVPIVESHTERLNNLENSVANIEPYIAGIPTIKEKAAQVFTERFNNKRFSTSNIAWNNTDVTLQQVLGPLLNFPNGLSTLRDWIQSVETRLNNINESGLFSVDLTEIESRISTLESKVAALESNSEND